ncbi:symplekin isoform X2 [Tanacetum coccineum]
MYFKMSWDRYGELSYFEFIWLLIVELQVDREHGYVHVFLYPSEKDFIAGRQFAIFIRKKDLYVVSLQDYRGKIYEIGKLGQCNRYFTHAHQTGFGEQYEELFQGSEGNLCGTWVGYDVLNDTITRVMLHWDDPSAWAWSCGVFALMFSEPCRFVWYHDKLGEIMTTKCNVRMLGRFYFLKVLPKKWREISIYARKKKTAHNEDLEAQPDSKIYTKTGAKNLRFYKRRAQDSLSVHLWQV